MDRRVSETEPLGFQPPVYPHDRLAPLIDRAAAHEGGLVDLSIGTPCDDPPEAVLAALVDATRARGYPPSIGSPQLREAIAGWASSFLGVGLDADRHIGACVGTKELVAGLPHWLHLRSPQRDTVLYPELSYPSYAMGARLAGCRAVPVPSGPDGLRLDRVDPGDIGRALCLWVNTPANPHGTLDDLEAVVRWGRSHRVLVVSDECYVAFTWETPHGTNPVGGPGRSVLEWGTDGVLAAHSLSKRSNLAGLRAGCFAGDVEIVRYLSEVRKHAGLMTPGPVQAAAAVAFADETHVDRQRDRYRTRLDAVATALGERGLPVRPPGGGFYLWVRAPDDDGWGLTRQLVERAGILGSPGDFYGPAGSPYVRLAMVQPDDRLELGLDRLRRADAWG